ILPETFSCSALIASFIGVPARKRSCGTSRPHRLREAPPCASSNWSFIAKSRRFQRQLLLVHKYRIQKPTTDFRSLISGAHRSLRRGRDRATARASYPFRFELFTSAKRFLCAHFGRREA